MDIDDMTLREVLAWLRRDCDPAWVALQSVAHEQVGKLSRSWRLQRADVEEVGDVVFLRIIDEDFAVLRCGAPSAPVAAWLTGVAKNVLRERRRAETRLNVRPLGDADALAEDRESDSEPSKRRAHRLSLHHLPPAQRAVMMRLKVGLSERRIAALLGVTRDNVHDVRRRAIARLRGQKKWVARRSTADRSWAVAAAQHARSAGDRVTARLLEMYAGGATRAGIAEETGLTMIAVKERIHRRRPRT